MTFALVLVFVVFVLAAGWIVSRRPAASRAQARLREQAVHSPCAPADLFLDRRHGWVRLGADGTLRVGVNNLLVELLGRVDRVELPSAGKHVERGDPLLVLHQGARRLSVPSPASGAVAEINSLLVEDPGALAEDPYGLAWAVSIRPRDHKEALAPLHVGNGAAGLLRAELERMTDFLVQATAGPGASPLLADGGALRRGVLSELDDASWQAFQERFLS